MAGLTRLAFDRPFVPDRVTLVRPLLLLIWCLSWSRRTSASHHRNPAEADRRCRGRGPRSRLRRLSIVTTDALFAWQVEWKVSNLLAHFRPAKSFPDQANRELNGPAWSCLIVPPHIQVPIRYAHLRRRLFSLRTTAVCTSPWKSVFRRHLKEMNFHFAHRSSNPICPATQSSQTDVSRRFIRGNAPVTTKSIASTAQLLLVEHLGQTPNEYLNRTKLLDDPRVHESPHRPIAGAAGYSLAVDLAKRNPSEDEHTAWSDMGKETSDSLRRTSKSASSRSAECFCSMDAAYPPTIFASSIREIFGS